MSESIKEDENALAVSSEQTGDAFLQSCFGKTLRVYTSDGRIFVGTFKCTDNVSIILRSCFECNQLIPLRSAISFWLLPKSGDIATKKSQTERSGKLLIDLLAWSLYQVNIF
jgi:small nuclear ribonucleoprotein (snRNP)-like protein